MRILLAAAIVLASSGAAAQTQAQMNASAASAWRAADAAMTRQWRQTQAYLKRLDAQDPSHPGPRYAALLLDSQRAWLKFRDTQCALEAAKFAGGSMQPLVQAQCLKRTTDERRQQLRSAMWR